VQPMARNLRDVQPVQICSRFGDRVRGLYAADYVVVRLLP
jgi:hypothetical protein